jgi:hypothetical protein
MLRRLADRGLQGRPPRPSMSRTGVDHAGRYPEIVEASKITPGRGQADETRDKPMKRRLSPAGERLRRHRKAQSLSQPPAGALRFLAPSAHPDLRRLALGRRGFS